jgi:hypothetical protein
MVIVFSRLDSENWNKLKYSMFSTSTVFPFSKPDEFQPIVNQLYRASPVTPNSPSIRGKYYEYHFTGGCDNPLARFIINYEDFQEFKDFDDPVYVNTTEGFDQIGEYSLYLDEPVINNLGQIIDFANVNKYISYHIKNTRENIVENSSKKIALYKTAKNTNGYLSIYPIRDFDFDFYDTTYMRSADSSYYDLYSWYQQIVPTGATPTFIYENLGPGATSFLQSLVGDGSAFAVGEEFQSISGISDDVSDTNTKVINEYDRLKEQLLPELALSSRVVPFINKWVYDNESTDVRENPYRLNTDQSFGYSNFSPSFDEIGLNPKFFTHEWYYLQKYPPYMSFYEKLNSYSYFDEDLEFPPIPVLGAPGSTAAYLELVNRIGPSANLLSIKEDYFLSYFTRETVEGVEIPRDFKYTLFEYGTDSYFSETLFRGAKVIIKDRSEFSPINFNIESLNFLANPKYNGYKFSAVLTYGESGTQCTFIKNDKWEAITLVITSDLNDDIFLKYKTGNITNKFIDRSSLYTLKHKLKPVLVPGDPNVPSDDKFEFVYRDINISGTIYKWEWLQTQQRWLV